MEQKLSRLECPLTWNLPYKEHYYEGFMARVKKLRKKSDFLIDGFCFTIIECFEKIRGAEFESAFTIANECKQMLVEYLPSGKFLKQDKYLWERCSDGMWHILNGTLAHLAFKDNDLKMAEKILQKTIPAETLVNSDLAAINGIKAKILAEYYIQKPIELSLEYARKAVRLDDSVPLWHHLLGKDLAQYRRSNNFFHAPSCEELDELEKAWKDSKRPEYGAMYLQSYQNALGKKVHSKSVEDNMKSKIEGIFREVQNSAGKEWFIYARLAHIAMRLPWNYNKTGKMKKLVDLANEYYKMENNSDDSFENSRSMMTLNCYYYKKIEKNFNQTLKYSLILAKTGVVGSAMDCITLSFKKNKKEDLCPLFDTFLAVFLPEFHNCKIQLSIYKANYLFFIKRDIKEAMMIYFKAMEDGSQIHLLKKCPIFFNEVPYGDGTYDTLQAVQSELSKLINNSSDEANKAMYMQYFQKLQELVNKEECQNSKDNIN